MKVIKTGCTCLVNAKRITQEIKPTEMIWKIGNHIRLEIILPSPTKDQPGRRLQVCIEPESWDQLVKADGTTCQSIAIYTEVT